MNIITSLGTGAKNNNNEKPMTYEEIEKWTIEKMDKILLMDSKEMAKYVLSMDTNSEIQNYLEELLGTTKKVQTFIEQLIKKINALPRRVSKLQKVVQPPTNQLNNQKKKNNNTNTTTTTTTTTTKSKGTKQSISSFKELEIEMRPGEPCECQATRHKLITNCLNCGKVICEQEGTGPCKFCSTPLFTNPLNLSQQQQALVEKNLNSAVEYKDRILGYQNTHAKRTMVYDDQEDYFSNSTNKWLTEEERKKVAKQELEFRQKQEDYKKQTRISIDFQGRRIISAPVDEKQFEIEKLSFTNSSNGGNNKNTKEYKSMEDFKNKNAEIDNDLGKDVKYMGTGKKREGDGIHLAGEIILGGNDDLITKQYYGVEEDIIVYNSKEVLVNSKLKYRGIMEGLWVDKSNTTTKRIPSISTYIKYIENLKKNGSNFISISPQNYIDDDFQFKNVNDDNEVIDKSKLKVTLPNEIIQFLKQLVDANKKISNGEVKINISISVPREFEFSNDSNFELIKNIIEMYKTQCEITSFSLILPSGWNDSFTLPICAPNSTKSEVNNSKTYSQTQTAFLNKLNQTYSKQTSLEFIICPSMFELNLNSGTPPPSRQQIEYWLEINKSTPLKYPLLFTTLSGSLQNSTLSKIKNIFDKRDLIVIEKYPYKNRTSSSSISSSLPIQWDPYHCGFDDYKSYLSGIIASPFDSQYYLDDQTTVITLSTTFIQYLKSPFNYQSELTLRANLIDFTDNNEDVADDLANLILALSNGVFDQINSIVQSKLLEKQQNNSNNNNSEGAVKNQVIDARDKIFFENLINSTSRVIDYFKNLPNDPLFDHLNLIKKTLLNYLQ